MNLCSNIKQLTQPEYISAKLEQGLTTLLGSHLDILGKDDNVLQSLNAPSIRTKFIEFQLEISGNDAKE